MIMKNTSGEPQHWKPSEASSSEIEDLFSLYIVGCVANIFLSCAAVTLNIITIQAIRKTSSLPPALKTLLLSLAVSDVGVGLLAQPFYVALLVRQLEENSQNVKLMFFAFIVIVTLFSFASLFGVMALSVDRFLAVHLHLRYQELVTHKRVVGAVISIWVSSAFLSLMTLWTPTNISYAIFFAIDICCLITTTLLNFKIFAAVWRLANEVQALQVQEEQRVTQNRREMTNVVSLRKSANSTFYIYLIFVICYLPQICSYVAVLFSVSKTAQRILLVCTLTVVFLNSSLNPVVYCLKMRHIRRTAMEILTNILPCYK